MKNRCLIILLLMMGGICKGQNLVPNPSFEENVGCPSNWNEFTKLKNWTRFNDATPDNFNTCDSSKLFGVPYNVIGFQNAATGNGYIGIIIYSQDGNISTSYREFVGCHLISPLVTGTKYYVTYKVSLTVKDSVGANYSSNNQCVLFTTLEYAGYSQTQYQLPILNFAHLRNLAIISDTDNWTTLSWTFIADSSYQYIVLGNFFEDGLTNGNLIIPSSFLWKPMAYYYIDDVCVSTDSLTCPPSKILNQTDIIIFSPNPFTTQLTITTKTTEPVEVTLYDVSSRKILHQKFTGSTAINTTLLARGIYLYELRNKNGVIKKGKVVKG